MGVLGVEQLWACRSRIVRLRPAWRHVTVAAPMSERQRSIDMGRGNAAGV